MRLIVGISGASGVVMGYSLLKALGLQKNCETYLVVSESARRNWKLETSIPFSDLENAANFCYDNNDLAAGISSGSFRTDGMIVIPCSMKTLSGIATGYATNLLLRSVDVCLKENRKVVLVPREMPFGKIHLRNMQTAAELGCTIIPPILTFYNEPQTLEDQINHVLGKILMQFQLNFPYFKPWKEHDDDDLYSR